MRFFVDIESILDVRKMVYEALGTVDDEKYRHRLYEESVDVPHDEWRYLYNISYTNLYNYAKLTDIFYIVGMEIVNLSVGNSNSSEPQSVTLHLGIKELGLETDEDRAAFIQAVESLLPIDGIPIDIDVVDYDVNDVPLEGYDIYVVYRGYELLDRITLDTIINKHTTVRNGEGGPRIYTPALLKEPMVLQNAKAYEDLFESLKEVYAGNATAIFLPVQYWCEREEKEDGLESTTE